MPLNRPLAIEGVAPRITTKSMASVEMPNHKMAAGTQATEGSTISPVISGPNPFLNHVNRASMSPKMVPRTTEMAKPRNARQRELPTASWISPLCSPAQIA